MSFRHPLPDPENSPRDGRTSGGTADKENALPAPRSIRDESTIQELIDVREAADNGQRLAPAIYRDLLAGAATPAGEATPDDSDLREAIEERLVAARSEFMSAMKLAGLAEEGPVHVALGSFVNQLDDLRSVLGERWGS